MREKINAKVLFDEDSWTRFLAEVPKVYFLFYFFSYLFNFITLFNFIMTLFQMKLVIPSALIERLKVNGSLARAALRYLEKVCHFFINYYFYHLNFKFELKLISFSFIRRVKSPRLKDITNK